MIEVEVKIPIENIEKIKQKLLETGFRYAEEGQGTAHP